MHGIGRKIIKQKIHRKFHYCALDDDDVVKEGDCELLRTALCEIGDDADDDCDDEITDVLLNRLPGSRKISIRRSLFCRLLLIDVILSRHV